ncbi:hypothetical protein LZ30DRAFT_742864 [Colletotrichum cereale]|nr:hypothetical protein LZ30DRAFT_742864 [Colletotrichum cereale]
MGNSRFYGKQNSIVGSQTTLRNRRVIARSTSERPAMLPYLNNTAAKVAVYGCEVSVSVSPLFTKSCSLL